MLYVLRPWTIIRYSSYREAGGISLTSAVWVQVVCLCLLWVIRFVVIIKQAVDKPSGVVTKPFDFFALADDSNKPAIYTWVSGVTLRCANSVLWIFTRFTTCAAMTGIGLSSSSDAPSPLSSRWPSSHSRSPTSCLNLFKRQVRRLINCIWHQRLAKTLMLGIGVSLL